MSAQGEIEKTAAFWAPVTRTDDPHSPLSSLEIITL